MITNRMIANAQPVLRHCLAPTFRQNSISSTKTCRRTFSRSRPASRTIEPVFGINGQYRRYGRNATLLLIAFYLVLESLGKRADAESPKTSLKDTKVTVQDKVIDLLPEDRNPSNNAANLQVKSSWENPGVYAWGLNANRVVAPGSDERWVKFPRRIQFFDGTILRDLKLSKTIGAAINEKGDLLQWGTGFSPNAREPETTLSGRNLKSIVLSEDRVIALADNGIVYSVPASKQEQESSPRYKEPSWFWSGTTNIGCRGLTPSSLSLGEKVVSLAGGRQHVLMLTSRGRVFSAASSTTDYPRHGQLGVPGLTWTTRPAGAFDQAHEVLGLKGLNIKQIAAGDEHSVALDNDSRVFVFGDNSYGQLGVPLMTQNANFNRALDAGLQVTDVPVPLPVTSLYANTRDTPIVKNISAGGHNTFLVVESQRDKTLDTGTRSRLPDVSSDAWACGRGIWGTLGVGKWIHVQYAPLKIAALSGMFEYDEKTQKPEPIRIGSFKVGESHVAAIMDNITDVTGHSSDKTSSHWGSDVYFFGNNESFQLGTGKRNNLAVPSHIQPLGVKTAASTDGIVTDRFQLTPAKKVTVGRRSVNVEQRVECGRQNSAVYSAFA